MELLTMHYRISNNSQVPRQEGKRRLRMQPTSRIRQRSLYSLAGPEWGKVTCSDLMAGSGTNGALPDCSIDFFVPAVYHCSIFCSASF
jgi:hypothetical protein